MMPKARLYVDCRRRPLENLQWFLALLAAALVLLPMPRGQAATQAPPTAKPPRHPVAAPSTYRLETLPRRAREYYNLLWGIDSLNVRQTESGELIRFSWRITDPERAKPLNDKKSEPELIDPQAGVKLVVPQMEFVGPLRETTTPRQGRISWIAFSNVGHRVKPGDRVAIVVGQFHVDGLLVQ